MRKDIFVTKNRPGDNRRPSEEDFFTKKKNSNIFVKISTLAMELIKHTNRNLLM